MFFHQITSNCNRTCQLDDCKLHTLVIHLTPMLTKNYYRKLMHTRPQIWGHPIAVDWAEPEVEVDEDVMATVKILYVRNLMLNTTEEQLEKVS